MVSLFTGSGEGMPLSWRTVARVLWVAGLGVLVAGCGGSATSGGGAAAIEDDPWRAVTNSADVLMGIEFSGAAGMLTVVNNGSESIGAPSLESYDLSTGSATSLSVSGAAEIAAGGSSSGSAAFPAAPADSALISVSLGGQQAAVFVPQATYAALSPAVLNPAVGLPADLVASPAVTLNPGVWHFSMSLSGVSCIPGGLSSSGDSEFYVSASGLSALWLADGNAVPLNLSLSGTDFRSPLYFFPVPNGDSVVYGTNRWTLTPQSQTLITGQLEWDNNLGCTASYPIQMDFVSLANPSIYALCEGTWSISYPQPIVCGSSVIDPAALSPLMPFGSGALDVTYAMSDPLSLSFGPLSGAQALPNIGGTNVYGTGFPNYILGATTDALGQPLVLVGGFQMTATSTSTIIGVASITGFGANPCSGSASFTMAAPPGC